MHNASILVTIHSTSKFIVLCPFFTVWEVSTGRCVKTFEVGGVVRSVAWCPNSALSLVAVAADRKLLLINPSVGDFLVVGKTDTLLDEPPEQTAIGKLSSWFYFLPFRVFSNF